MTASRAVVFAPLEGYNPGHVLVDDPDQPRSACIAMGDASYTKERALGVNRDHFGAVKVQASRATPKRWLLRRGPAPRPGSTVEVGDWGCYAMAAAFEYRVERRPDQFKRVRDMLWASLNYYLHFRRKDRHASLRNRWSRGRPRPDRQPRAYARVSAPDQRRDAAGRLGGCGVSLVSQVRDTRNRQPDVRGTASSAGQRVDLAALDREAHPRAFLVAASSAPTPPSGT